MRGKHFLLLIFASFIFYSFDRPSNAGRVTKTVSLSNVTNDSTEIKSLIEKYAESISNADTVLASALFAHSNEVSFIHPRGHEQGWAEINNHIYKFFGDFFSERKLSISNEHITVYGDAAWVEFYWVFDGTIKKDNSSLQTKGIETQVWRKTKNEWHLVHVHYSDMPGSNG